MSCNIFPDKKCLIKINEASDNIHRSANSEKCFSPASIQREGKCGSNCEVILMNEIEIDKKRRIIDESYYDDEIDIEGKENVLLTNNEQNRLGNFQSTSQIQIMQQRCPFLWKTSDSLIGIGKRLIKISKDRDRVRNKIKLNRNFNKFSHPNHSPSLAFSSVASILKVEEGDNMQLLKSSLQNKMNKGRDSSYSQSSNYDSDDILSSFGGDCDLSDYDRDKREIPCASINDSRDTYDSRSSGKRQQRGEEQSKQQQQQLNGTQYSTPHLTEQIAEHLIKRQQIYQQPQEIHERPQTSQIQQLLQSNLQIRDSVLNKVFIEDFSFRPPSLTIYAGTFVEFILKNNTSVHKLGCENEFSGIDMNYNNRSYKHRFLSAGYYEVQNEIFSFMVCRITVIECTEAKSSNHSDDIVSTTTAAPTTSNIDPAVVAAKVAINDNTAFIAATKSMSDSSSLVPPITTICTTTALTTVTAVGDASTYDTIVVDTIPTSGDIKCSTADPPSQATPTVTIAANRPSLPASNYTHHLLHGSFAADIDPINSHNAATPDCDNDTTPDDIKIIETPSEIDYQSTTDISTSIIAAMWKTSKSLESSSKSMSQVPSTALTSTIQTSMIQTIVSTPAPHVKNFSTAINMNTMDEISTVLNEKTMRISKLKPISTSTFLMKSSMTSTMTSTMTFTTITTAAATATITAPSLPSSHLTSSPLSSSPLSSSSLHLSINDNKRSTSESGPSEIADIGTSVVAAMFTSIARSLLASTKPTLATSLSCNSDFNDVTNDSAVLVNMDPITEVPISAILEGSVLKQSLSSRTIMQPLSTSTQASTQTSTTVPILTKPQETSNFQLNPLLPAERLAQLTASSQSLLELISIPPLLPPPLLSKKTVAESSPEIAQLLHATIAKCQTVSSSSTLTRTISTPTRGTGPLSITAPTVSSTKAITSNSTVYSGLRGSFGVITSTQSPTKEITDAIRNSAKNKGATAATALDNDVTNESGIDTNIIRISETPYGTVDNNDCQPVRSDEYKLIDVNDDERNIETIRSGRQKRNTKKNLKRKSKKINGLCSQENDSDSAVLDTCVIDESILMATSFTTAVASAIYISSSATSVTTTSTSTAAIITPSTIIFTTTSASSTSATVTNDTTIASRPAIIPSTTADDSTNNITDIAKASTMTPVTPVKPLIVSIYSPYTNTTTDIETQTRTPSSHQRVDSLLSSSLYRERVLFSVDWEDIDSDSEEEYNDTNYHDDIGSSSESNSNNDRNESSSKSGRNHEDDKIVLNNAKIGSIDDKEILPNKEEVEEFDHQYLKQNSDRRSMDISSNGPVILGKKGVNYRTSQEQNKPVHKSSKVLQNQQHKEQQKKIRIGDGAVSSSFLPEEIYHDDKSSTHYCTYDSKNKINYMNDGDRHENGISDYNFSSESKDNNMQENVSPQITSDFVKSSIMSSSTSNTASDTILNTTYNASSNIFSTICSTIPNTTLDNIPSSLNSQQDTVSPLMSLSIPPPTCHQRVEDDINTISDMNKNNNDTRYKCNNKNNFNTSAPVNSLTNKLKNQLGIGQNKTKKEIISPFCTSLQLPTTAPHYIENKILSQIPSPVDNDINTTNIDDFHEENNSWNYDKNEDDIEDFLTKRK